MTKSEVNTQKNKKGKGKEKREKEEQLFFGREKEIFVIQQGTEMGEKERKGERCTLVKRVRSTCEKGSDMEERKRKNERKKSLTRKEKKKVFTKEENIY